MLYLSSDFRSRRKITTTCFEVSLFSSLGLRSKKETQPNPPHHRRNRKGARSEGRRPRRHRTSVSQRDIVPLAEPLSHPLPWTLSFFFLSLIGRLEWQQVRTPTSIPKNTSRSRPNLAVMWSNISSLAQRASDGLRDIETQINQSLGANSQADDDAGGGGDDIINAESQHSAAQSSEGWEKCSEPDLDRDHAQEMSFVDLKSAVDVSSIDDVENRSEAARDVSPSIDLATALKMIKSLERQNANLKQKLEDVEAENAKLKTSLLDQKQTGESSGQ